MDIEAVVGRLDPAALTREVIDAFDLPEILRASSGVVSSQGARTVRSEGMHADGSVLRWLDRVLRRPQGRQRRRVRDGRERPASEIVADVRHRVHAGHGTGTSSSARTGRRPRRSLVVMTTTSCRTGAPRTLHPLLRAASPSPGEMPPRRGLIRRGIPRAAARSASLHPPSRLGQYADRHSARFIRLGR